VRLLKVPQQGGRGVRRGLGGNRRSAAFLQLYERGKLDLDAPVQKYCPAFPQRDSLTTSRQLLAHLGGIRHYNKDGKGDVPDDCARLTSRRRSNMKKRILIADSNSASG